MRRFFRIVLAVFAMSFMGHNVSAQNADSIAIEIDSIAAIDSVVGLDPDPEWYVSPDSLEVRLAARRRMVKASSCTLDSICTFDIDSILKEVTVYEHVGDTNRTIVWTINSDGSRVGKSKTEDVSTTMHIFHATYGWDDVANTWSGTEKLEYFYNYFYGVRKLESGTSFTWENGAWVADSRYTYNFNESLQEIEYYEYTRNAFTNQLEYSKGRIQTWIDETRRSLEILYTAYSNGNWIAGTKKEWAFDAEGRQTSYTYYSTITNGNWVGSSKETWTYGGPAGQLTLHEQFGWASSDWSKTLKEETEYSGAKIIRVESYTYANGVPTGTKKETWTYGGPSGQLTLHEQFGWVSSDWSKTLKEETQYSGANVIRIENYTYANGVPTGTKKELTTYTSGKKTQILTFAWENGDWVDSNKETWEFNGPSNKQTKHEKSDWDGSAWTIMVQENTTYNSNTTIVENYERIEGVLTGTKKESNTVVSGKPTETIIYDWNGSWVESTKENWTYTNGKLTKHEFYEWTGDWTKTLEENTLYFGNNVSQVTNYALIEGVWTGTMNEQYAYTSGQKTSSIVYAWDAAASDWVEESREAWGFTSGKQTLYETYVWNGSWVRTLQENTTYDGANITLIENYALVEGDWKGTKKEEYTYVSGEKTKSITYTWSSGWVYATKNEAGYQDGNTTVSAANYTWNGSMWTGTGTLTRTTYDENNREIEVLKLNWPTNATEWTYSTRTVNTYNADGIKILSHSTKWKNDKWVLTSMTRIDIIKDNEGRTLLNASWKCSSDSVWKGVQKDTTYYSATGNWLFDAHYASWKNNKWVLSYKKQRIYDDADRLVLDERYNWKNNTEVGDYRYEYEYDADGRQIMTTSYSGWNSVLNNWIGNSKRAYTFDANGRKESEFTFTWEDNAWAYLFAYHYQYDAAGREIERIVQQWLISKWINTEKLEKEYRGSTLVKNNVYHWISKNWQLYNQNELYYDFDAQAKLRREIEGVWDNNGVVQSYNDKHYMYSCDPCIIRFVNYDGELLESQALDKGVTPNYGGATPTRPEDAENTYTFKEWAPAITAVTGNATYTATYTATKKNYTVTWQYKDGTEIDHATYAYGVIPTHADAEKAATAEWTYTFKGWDPGMGMVTGDATYTAEFDSIKNKYTIIFQNYDGTELQRSEVTYGETLVYAGAEPSKPADAQDTYNFAGWDPQVVAVTGNATYTAQYTSTVNSYTIKFMNGETELQSSQVAYGEMPVYEGATPTKDATAQYTYDFSGWDSEIVAVTGAKTYNAQFTSTVNSYTITFMNGEEILQTGEVAYGETPEYTGATPTKPADAQDTYTFAGWSPEIAAVTGTATYTATFTGTTNKYLITFKNGETELQSSEVDYGETPSYTGATPTKPADAQYTYTFSGWDPQVVAVIGSKTYTAQFSSTVNKYTIKFMNGETELQSSEVEYGETPVYTAATPTKDATAQYTYTFAGWDKEIASVTGDETYTAQFSSEVNSYTVTWVDENDIEISHETLEYGATPQHADASKQNTAEYTYTFTGWTPAIVDVTGDATYKATFSQTKNSYTVTWVDENDTEISHETLEYGTTPSHADMSKDNTAEWTYNFEGWTPAIVDVTGDATYKATFSQTKNSYVITFLNYDGTELQTGDVEYGVVPTYTSATPTKPADAQGTYTFAGWDEEIAAVTGAKTYTATFTGVKGTYTITFYFGDGVTILSQMELAYGEMPEMTLEPARLADPEFSYTFAGWEPAIAPVTADADYVAVYTATTNSYTIIFRNDDGTELQRDVLEYGILPIYAGEEPTKEEDERYTYEFAGWKPAVDIAKADAVYTATYTATKKKKQDIEDVVEAGAQATKIYIEGNIYILRAGHAYAPDGTKLY